MASSKPQAPRVMPAEWEPHEATWISWPKNTLTFPDKMLTDVEMVFCQMVEALQKGEKVKILVDGEEHEDKVRQKLAKYGLVESPNLRFYHIKTADVWCRDYCPIFVKAQGGKKSVVKWDFNAWGNKYDDLLYDNEAGKQIAMATFLDMAAPGIVLEGGSIEVNGQGTLMTTEQCLLNKNRNPKLNKAQIENYLKEHLGASNVIWLKEGIEGDDTDGHIDDFARFVSEDTVVISQEESKSDPNCEALKNNFDALARAKLENGKPLKIIKLPMPSPTIDKEENRRLPASYANFYIGNSVVLLPVFNDKNDKQAIEVMKKLFPTRTIVPIFARDLVYGYGGIHCATMQEPK